MPEAGELRIGPAHYGRWWDERVSAHPGPCQECGGECDGEHCGLHAAGCIFGGGAELYWMYAEGCPLDHGVDE